MGNWGNGEGPRRSSRTPQMSCDECLKHEMAHGLNFGQDSRVGVSEMHPGMPLECTWDDFNCTHASSPSHLVPLVH